MLRGLPASIILHAAVIGSGMIVLPNYRTATFQDEVAIIPIDLVEIGAVTNVAPRIEREPEEAEPEEEAPPPLEEFLEDVDTLPELSEAPPEELPPPPPPPEEETPEPEPEPALEAEPEEEAPEPEPEPEAEPEPEPVLREPERDPLDDILGDAANLFDRAPREPRAAPPRPAETPELRDEAPSERRRGAGERTGNIANVQALIQAQMYVCWQTVDDLPNPERLNVTLRVFLNRDGTLARNIELVDPRRAPIGDRPMTQAIERAMRAARKCAPYRLPAEDYEIWQEITMNVGPGFRND